MRAVVITRTGGPEVLEIRERPGPVPGKGEIGVRVRASAVNRADLLQRMGAYPAPEGAPADIPGIEFAGEVDSVGEAVTEWKVGDRVCGLVGGGAYAERLTAHARTVSRIPTEMTFTEAAAVPEAFITAYDAMVTQGRLAPGETVLVPAVGSGVGTAAVQIARVLGARSIGTSRTADKLERARPLGMTVGLVVERDGRFTEKVLELTSGYGVDCVLELVGGKYVSEDILCTAPRGRIVIVGLMAGARAELDLALIMRKRLEITGTVLRARPLEEKILAAQLFDRHLLPLFSAGSLEPVVDKVYPLAKVADAHVRVAGNEGFGKVILEIA